MRAVHLVVFALVGLGACRRSAEKTAASASASAAMPAPPSASVVASASAPPVGALSLVAEAPDDMRFAEVRGPILVQAAHSLFALENGRLEQRPGLVKGAFPGQGGVFGDFPNAATAWNWDSTGVSISTWFNGQWVEDRSLLANGSIAQIAPWGDHAAIAVVFQGNDAMFVPAGGKSPGVMPVVPKGDRDDCPVTILPSSMRLAGLPTGHLFLVGKACNGGKALAARFEPKKREGTVVELPANDPPQLNGVAAAAADDAYAYGAAGQAPYLAHFDGSAWKLEQAPFDAPVAKLVFADDGTAFAMLAGAAPAHVAWKRPRAGAWAPIEHPELAGKKAGDVAARSAADFAIIVRADRALLLATQAAGPAVKLPSAEAMDRDYGYNHRLMMTDACVAPYAHLYTVGPSGTPPKKFPPLEAAFADDAAVLERARLVVEDDGAQLYVGAIAPSVDAAKKIAAKFKDKNPKMVPRLFCHEPRVTKTIAL